jgi:acyl dehydratase
MRVFGGVEELRAAAGGRIGTSDWITVERSRIERFVEATDDHDWIPAGAGNAPDSRFSDGVAHGFSPCRCCRCWSGRYIGSRVCGRASTTG